MKILIIGESSFNSLERIYQKNFKVLNCKIVNIISLLKPKNKIKKKIINFQEKYLYNLYCFIQNLYLKKKIQKDLYDYDIILVFNGYHLNKKILECLKLKTKGTLVNIQTDNIFAINNIVKNNLNYFDQIYIWSETLKNKIINQFKIRKNKVLLLPFGFDQFIVKKPNYNQIRNQILFYGSWDEERENKLKHIDKKVLKIYGNGWQNASKNFKKDYQIRKELVGKKLVEQISKSLLCLNLFRPQAKNFINMRSFEVIGYGGRLISEFSHEQNLFFKSYKNMVYFNNINEIKYLYENILNKKFKFINDSKKNQRKIIKHNYLNRAKYILKNAKKKIIR